MSVLVAELPKHFETVADFILVCCESKEDSEAIRQTLISNGHTIQYNLLDSSVFWFKVYLNPQAKTIYQLKMDVSVLLSKYFSVTCK